MRTWKLVKAAAGLLLGLITLCGQPALATGSIKVSDLPLIEEGSAPRGTFYLLSLLHDGRAAPPSPFDPYQGNFSIYVLNADRRIYLIGDAVQEEVSPDQFPAGTFGAEEMSYASAASGMEMETELESGGPGFTAFCFSSDDLWLELSAKTNSTGYFVIHPPEAEVGIGVYDLYVTHSLSPNDPGLNLTNWQWLARCESGQTNLIVPGLAAPRAYFILGRTNSSDTDTLSDAFEKLVSHSSVTNTDTDGDSLPDDWEWNNFGSFSQTTNGNYDGDNRSNLGEYQSGTDPNTITFGLAVDRENVNFSPVSFSLIVTSGVPSSIAIAINSSDFKTATWMSYGSSNLSIDLGIEGRKDIWIGLRGRMITSEQTWHWARFTLDVTPPVLVITNLPASTLSQPVLQLKGFCPEPLETLDYDLTNALGLFTNVSVPISGQDYNATTMTFTTNYFQAYDVELAEGVNQLALHAVDRAGNVTTTNFTFTLQSDTVAPLLSLRAPRNGMRLAGSSFLVHGIVDDPTAKLSVELVNTNGVTNTFPGLVERNGKFWFESLPFMADTNQIKVIATDAWGNTASTNVTVTRSSLALTLSVDTGLLYQGAVDVVGSIGASNYSVSGLTATRRS